MKGQGTSLAGTKYSANAETTRGFLVLCIMAVERSVIVYLFLPYQKALMKSLSKEKKIEKESRRERGYKAKIK